MNNNNINFYETLKKADAGDADSQYEAAYHILYEIGLTDSVTDKEIVDKAIGFLRSSAMSGSSYGLAAQELGEQYFSGKYIAQDFRQAAMWFRAATQKLQPIGYYYLGNCFLCGYGVEQNNAKAFDSFFKGALTGYINNYIKIGDMFRIGLFVKRDVKYAMEMYNHVCDTELDMFKKIKFMSDAYGQVCLRLGECYLYGCGVAMDIDLANFYFAEAKKHAKGSHWANKKFIDSESKRLLRYLDSIPYTGGNALEYADDNINHEISNDDFIVMMKEKLPEYKLKYYPEKEMKVLLSRNPIVESFDDVAFCDIYDGVQKKDPKSMYKMAMICYSGDKNIPVDPMLREYGIYLFHQSLLGGCREPLINLGGFYSNNIEVAANYEIALWLYELHDCPCVYNCMGTIYANGKGIKRNRIKAYQYFAKYLLSGDIDDHWVYKNMTVIYPHLKRFEQDKVFIDFLHKKHDEAEAGSTN